MPPKQIWTIAVPRTTRTVTQGTQKAQTSGIFKLPVEILFEIFSYFDDHRRFIRKTCHGPPTYTAIKAEHVEQSTVVRKLTMTCLVMRNTLLPVLWKDVEGCFVPHPGGHTYGLYDQCVCLLSNPGIAPYVQIFSVDLMFKDAPKDLMRKFVDTLIRLPNLRTLELLSITHRGPVTAGLKRKCATFPNIREMIINSKYPDFVASCPNLESLTFRNGLTLLSCVAINLRRAELKCIEGIDCSRANNLSYVVQDCPNLQEIGLCVQLWWQTGTALEGLRSVENLIIVKINFLVGIGRSLNTPQHIQEEGRKMWKRDSVNLLKNTSSKDRKFLRWRTTTIGAHGEDHDIIESGELEVLPETTL